MKGLVVDCLKELVISNFGSRTWHDIVVKSEVDPNRNYTMNEDVNDEIVLKMFGSTCEITGMEFMQACEAFGEFWVSHYTRKHYPEFYEGVSSAKEFLVKLDAIHSEIRKRIPNAKPPKLHYDWKDNTTVIVGYKSSRDLTELFAGTIKGLARHYNEKVKVEILNRESIAVEFLN